MNGIIVYRSSYGSTKQYAQWIHEETGFPLYDNRDKKIPWETADTVVIGCPVIANKAFLTGWIEKNWEKMKGKDVVLFTTSGANPSSAPVKDWVSNALPQRLRSDIHVFPLAGKFDFSDLNGMHKMMMRIGAVITKGDDIKSQMKNPVNGVNRANLSNLLEYVQRSSR